MASISEIAKQTKQPYGGYLNPKKFTVISDFQNSVPLEGENIRATIIGATVKHLTQFCLSGDLGASFSQSLAGYFLGGDELPAPIVIRNNQEQEMNIVDVLMNVSQNLSTRAVASASVASAFDIWGEDMETAFIMRSPWDNLPNVETVGHIREMVKTSCLFFRKYGPVTKVNADFSSGYTKELDAGTGDIVTEDTIWTVKVTKGKLSSKHTLQAALTYLLAGRTDEECFRQIKNIGVWNPRTGLAYTVNAEKVKTELEIIGRAIFL